MLTSERKKSSYTRDELVSCGTGGLFGIATAKLPTGNMLMFDRIAEINDSGGRCGKGCIEAVLDISPSLW
jgi:3-hydroxyacyl-[acyl-carrier protein] dehydratase/trans-2-decenoyl-[acyl-carrier protein] isomerase